MSLNLTFEQWTMLIMAGCSAVMLVWTIWWSVYMKRQARQSELVDKVTQIERTSEKAHTRIDQLDSKVDALPTSVQLTKLDGDLNSLRTELKGVRDLLNGQTKWMERMDSYLHQKDT